MIGFEEMTKSLTISTRLIIDKLEFVLENEPVSCLSLLFIWMVMLVLIYRDAKGLDLDQKKVVGSIFFGTILLIFLFDYISDLFYLRYFQVSIFIRNIFFFMGIPVLIWLLYRNLWISGRGLRSPKTSVQPSLSDEAINKESKYESTINSKDSKMEYEPPEPSDSSSLNRCPECGRKVEDEWNVCIDCGTSLK